MNRLSYRSAVTLGTVSLCIRAFFAAFVDSPEMLGAGWLGVLAGGAMFLPAVGALYVMARICPDQAPEDALRECVGAAAARILFALLALSMLYDTAAVARILMVSSIFEEYRLTAPFWAVLPSLLAAVLVVLAGANGVGGTAGLFLRFAPFFFALIIGVHFRNYQPARLVPILGMGWPAIFQGGGKIAGALAPITALWLVQSGKQTGYARHKRRAPAWMFPALYGTIVLISTVLVALALMLETNVFTVPQSRIYRLHLLLSNGSSPTYLQLPYVGIWYGSLLCAQGFSLFAASRLFVAALPRASFSLVTWLCALMAALIAGFRLAEQPIVQFLAPWQAAGTGILIIASSAVGCIRKGVKAK